ncbi:MAG: ATP-binding protein [Clostridia bacterium]|nr:ATP-binding protein [Clostridia bacterium]
MSYNKENFKRIRAEYETKALRAEEDADARRRELHQAIPELRILDSRLSSFGLRIMDEVLKGGDCAKNIAALRAENESISTERAALLRQHGYPENYSSPRYECDACRDTGYVGIKMCDCMRRRLIEAGMESSGLSALMKKQSFDNFSLDYYHTDSEVFSCMSRNLEIIRDYAENFRIEPDKRAPESLLFLGGTGLGKTHLSTSIARVVIERGYDVFYNSAVGMLSDFESRRFGNGMIESEGDNTARYTECELLIIDDLGTEVVNQFTLSCLYHVLNTRLNLQKPTIISTNLSSSELRKNYHDRIISRLMGEYRVIPFLGVDIRRQKIQ